MRSQAGRLKERLRDVLEVPTGADLLLGNGSDELIQLLILAIGGPGSVVFAPDPSFAMYALVARATGRRFESVALDGLQLRVERVGASRYARQRSGVDTHHVPAVSVSRG